MNWKKEREIVKKYKLDMYSGSYERLKEIMNILNNFEYDLNNIDEYNQLKEYEKFIMRQYLNTNK